MPAFTDPPNEAPNDDPAARQAAADQAARKEEVLTTFRRRLGQSKAHTREWRSEARNLYEANAGRQWDPEDEARMRDAQRPMVTFNVMGKFLDAVGGLQINNRQDIRYFPREEGDSQVNELLTGSVTWSRDMSGMADEETDSFFDLCLVGMGWMEGYLNEDGEPAGWPAADRCDPLEMFWDHKARKRNLADSRWMCRVKNMDRMEYRDMFGEDPGVPLDMGTLLIEDEHSPQIIDEPQDYGPPRGSSSAQPAVHGTIPVANYQWWEKQDRFLVTADQLGSQEFSKEQWAATEPLLQARGIAYQAKPIRRKVYFRAFIDASGVRELIESPYQYGFTFHAMTGKRDRNTNTWYGIGRAVMDPQKWLNKFFSSILDIIARNSKGGLMAEQDAFVNPEKAISEWSRPDSVTMLATGALQKGKVMEKKPADYPQGLDRLMQFAMEALPSTSGLNLELLGLVDREQSGVLEAGRKQSAMAIIAWAFDALRAYYRSMGRMLACYIRDYVDEGTLVRINGEQGAKYVPLLKDKLALTFDVIVDEAPTSTNMKERTWAALGQLIPQLLQAGIPVPPKVLDYSPLPTDLVQEWKKTLENPEKAQQSMQQFEAMLRKLFAETAQKQADAGLKEAQTDKTRAEAALAQVNTLTAAAEAGAAQAGTGVH